MCTVDRSVGAPAGAGDPAERGRDAGEVSVRLDQDVSAIVGTQEVGAEVALIERDLHRTLPDIRC